LSGDAGWNCGIQNNAEKHDEIRVEIAKVVSRCSPKNCCQRRAEGILGNPLWNAGEPESARPWPGRAGPRAATFRGPFSGQTKTPADPSL